jgi:hypothetical protein
MTYTRILLPGEPNGLCVRNVVAVRETPCTVVDSPECSAAGAPSSMPSVISYPVKQRSTLLLWLLMVIAATPLFWLSLEQLRWLVPEGRPAPPPALGFLGLPFMAMCTLGVVIALLVEIATPRRWERMVAGLGALGVIFGTLPCIGPMFDVSTRQGLTTISRNGAPLIRALRSYQKDHHRYPEQLTELTPDYLTGLPTEPSCDRFGGVSPFRVRVCRRKAILPMGAHRDHGPRYERLQLRFRAGNRAKRLAHTRGRWLEIPGRLSLSD